MHLLNGLFNDTKFIADATLLNEQRSNFHFDFLPDAEIMQQLFVLTAAHFNAVADGR